MSVKFTESIITAPYGMAPPPSDQPNAQPLSRRHACGRSQIVVGAGRRPYVIRYRCNRLDCPACLAERNARLTEDAEIAKLAYMGEFSHLKWEALRKRVQRAKAVALRLPQKDRMVVLCSQELSGFSPLHMPLDQVINAYGGQLAKGGQKASWIGDRHRTMQRKRQEQMQRDNVSTNDSESKAKTKWLRLPEDFRMEDLAERSLTELRLSWKEFGKHEFVGDRKLSKEEANRLLEFAEQLVPLNRHASR